MTKKFDFENVRMTAEQWQRFYAQLRKRTFRRVSKNAKPSPRAVWLQRRRLASWAKSLPWLGEI